MPCNNDCFDVIEIIQDRVKDEYQKDVSHDEAMDILMPALDNGSLSHFVDDAVCEYAKEKGWEEK